MFRQATLSTLFESEYHRLLVRRAFDPELSQMLPPFLVFFLLKAILEEFPFTRLAYHLTYQVLSLIL
jgi:hypothetical protein